MDKNRRWKRTFNIARRVFHVALTIILKKIMALEILKCHFWGRNIQSLTPRKADRRGKAGRHVFAQLEICGTCYQAK